MVTMWYDGGGGWGGWFAMGVMMVIFWGLVIAGIVVLVHYLGSARRDGRSGPPHVSGGRGWGAQGRAEDLLAERFARGEIDEEEYKRRLALLREHR